MISFSVCEIRPPQYIVLGSLLGHPARLHALVSHALQLVHLANQSQSRMEPAQVHDFPLESSLYRTSLHKRHHNAGDWSFVTFPLTLFLWLAHRLKLIIIVFRIRKHLTA